MSGGDITCAGGEILTARGRKGGEGEGAAGYGVLFGVERVIVDLDGLDKEVVATVLKLGAGAGKGERLEIVVVKATVGGTDFRFCFADDGETEAEAEV